MSIPSPSQTRFAEFLTQSRTKKFRSARKFYESCGAGKENTLGISYSLYADYEAGKKIPDLAFCLRWARLLSVSDREILNAWTLTQIPEEETELGKWVEESLSKNAPSTSQKSSVASGIKAISRPPQFENTWVMNARDLEWLSDEAALWPFLQRMAFHYPKTIDVPVELMSHAALKAWGSEGRIITHADQVSVKVPYIHLPKTPEWDSLRGKNLVHATRILMKHLNSEELSKSMGVRELICRKMSPDDLKTWSEKFTALAQEFLAHPYADVHDKDSVALVIALGVRPDLS